MTAWKGGTRPAQGQEVRQGRWGALRHVWGPNGRAGHAAEHLGPSQTPSTRYLLMELVQEQDFHILTARFSKCF